MTPPAAELHWFRFQQFHLGLTQFEGVMMRVHINVASYPDSFLSQQIAGKKMPAYLYTFMISCLIVWGMFQLYWQDPEILLNPQLPPAQK